MVGHKCPDHRTFLSRLQTLGRVIDRLVIAIAGEGSLTVQIFEICNRFVR